MPWGVRATLVSWANCSVGVPSCPAPPRRPAVRTVPTRPWYVRVLDSTNCFNSQSGFLRSSSDGYVCDPAYATCKRPDRHGLGRSPLAVDWLKTCYVFPMINFIQSQNICDFLSNLSLSSPRLGHRTMRNQVFRPRTTRFLPGQALHEKGIRKYPGMTLDVNQEQRAAAVLRKNWSSIARQPVIVFCDSVYVGFRLFVRASEGTSGMVVFGSLEGKMGGCFLGEPTSRRPTAPCPAPPRPPHRCAPPRPDPPVVFPGFGSNKGLLPSMPCVKKVYIDN